VPNYIDSTSFISKLSDIEESKKGSILRIGSGSFIDSFVKIKFAGGVGDVIIGSNCYINSGTVIYSGNGIKIGNKVLIAANCTLASSNHGIRKEFTFLEQTFMQSKGGITIEDDVWIGANSVILDGAYLSVGTLIGAGAVVKGRTEAYGIYYGNPISLRGFRA
jgi:acetyltransferase-like isoleucine patch superfamily enzyme